MSAVELDINQFINEANDAVPSADFVATPENEYAMYIKPGSTKIFDGESEKGGKYRLYTAQVVVDDEGARQATNLEQPTARIRMFLDVTETGSLAKGPNRNVKLGALLRATGQDRPGWTYGALEGVAFKGRVKHVPDNRDANRVNAEVVTFTRAS
jgi:hypothetical protein